MIKLFFNNKALFKISLNKINNNSNNIYPHRKVHVHYNYRNKNNNNNTNTKSKSKYNN